MINSWSYIKPQTSIIKLTYMRSNKLRKKGSKESGNNANRSIDATMSNS